MELDRHRRVCVLAAFVLALVVSAQEEKRLMVYAPQSTYTVTIRERDNREYVALMDLLQPLGGAAGKLDGDKFKVRIAGDESQFQAGKSKAKIQSKNVDMGAPVLIEDGLTLVPVSGLAQVLPRLLSQSVDVREAGRRVLIGPVANDFSAEMQASPTRLVLHFSKPVNPSISNEGGRVRMNFTKDPVVGSAATQSFNDKLITSATFAEHNGTAELTVSATAPLLATFSDENRTITLAAAPQTTVAAQPRPAPPPPVAGQPPEPVAAAPAVKPGSAIPAPSRPRFLVVIDPAHGGDDRGALLAAGVEEKELTLAFARRLRAALERLGISSMLLRDGDTAVSIEQRAIAANTARGAVFVSVHAGSVGRGVRTYTARLEETLAKPGAMVPWDSAQSAYLGDSRNLAASIASELSKRSVQHAESPAQLQPLNHVTSAAVAVEFLPDKSGVASLASAQYQQTLCAAVADAIAAARNTLEARK